MPAGPRTRPADRHSQATQSLAGNDDDILDDLFHGCAIAAYLDQATEQGGPPDSEATRRRAYRYYEEALAARQP